ncbi:MAG: hypothetical protein NVS3B7_19370 [Candidatus Elarobacter sp.]
MNNTKLPSIIALVLQAFTLRDVAFAVTLGGKHLLVNISQSSTVNHFSFSTVLPIVFQIMGGQTGHFQVGAVAVDVETLQTAPAPAAPAAPRPASI